MLASVSACMQVPAPEAVLAAGYQSVQFTLVDCPGHASLIRTVIGGAQIIDMMILVVDITKGG
jgi:selenocysteine-specific elongation factor